MSPGSETHDRPDITPHKMSARLRSQKIFSTNGLQMNLRRLGEPIPKERQDPRIDTNPWFVEIAEDAKRAWTSPPDMQTLNANTS